MQASFRSIVVVLALFVCAGFAAPERIDYTLTPIMRAGALEAVQIDLRFRGEADGETALALPSAWGGQEELWRGIDDLTVVSGAALQPGATPAARTLTHRPNARIHLRYRVIQDWEGPPMAQGGNPYRPIIQVNYFHLIGNAALVTPDNYNLLSPVRLNVRYLPRGWRFASDLEHQGTTLGEVAASIIVGGDFRIVQTADPNIRIAMRGAQWRFTDADFAARVAEIIAAQRRFWGDESSPFLVTVIELGATNSGWLSMGGTGLGDSFAFFATPNVEPEALPRMLAHEGLHTWIPSRIGGLAEVDEASGYWFSEGFTDFYTGRILVREGIWDPAQFAADFNRTLRDYAVSSVRTAPNARILADFWRDRDLQQLPYQRGRMLATLWDVRLRAQGRDVDEVVHEMRARRRGRSAEGARHVRGRHRTFRRRCERRRREPCRGGRRYPIPRRPSGAMRSHRKPSDRAVPSWFRHRRHERQQQYHRGRHSKLTGLRRWVAGWHGAAAPRQRRDRQRGGRARLCRPRRRR
jgi:predicted metalloprotease with PDZ domain